MPSMSFLFPTEHKFPSYEISFLPTVINVIMPIILQKEGEIIIRHSVSISKFRYLTIEKKQRKEKNTTKER